MFRAKGVGGGGGVVVVVIIVIITTIGSASGVVVVVVLVVVVIEAEAEAAAAIVLAAFTASVSFREVNNFFAASISTFALVSMTATVKRTWKLGSICPSQVKSSARRKPCYSQQFVAFADKHFNPLR